MFEYFPPHLCQFSYGDYFLTHPLKGKNLCDATDPLKRELIPLPMVLWQVRKLVCASNENNAITEVLKKGIYDVRKRKLVSTPSPSMDIIAASNFERLLYEVSKDPKKVNNWMNDLKNKGIFTLDNKTKSQIQKLFYADWVSNKDCLKAIKSTFAEMHYLIDPHTAVVLAVAESYKQRHLSNTPIVICSTAHFAKFPKDVYEALIENKTDEDEFSILEKLVRIAPNTYIPKGISELKNKKVKHTRKSKLGKSAVKQVILQYLKKDTTR